MDPGPVASENRIAHRQVTDELGIHREQLIIPLGPATPGRVRRLLNGKLEITVEASRPIGEWLRELPQLIAAAQGK